MDPVDPSVKPGDSFYDYANNDWLSKTSIPAEKSRWTVFNVLDELSKTHLKALFEDLEKEPVGSSIVAELYSAGMDTATIDAKGLAPIQDLLNSVASLQSKQEIWKLVAKLSKQSFGSFFAFGVSPDAKNSTTAVFQFAQGGLGLPDRDFYELESKKEQREKYVLHIAKMNVLAGISQQDADSQAKLVYDFEVILAKHSLKMVERRDPVKTYNKKTVAELKTLSPQIDWDGFFGELGLSKLGSVVIESPAYFSELSKLVEISPIEQLKAYIKFRILTTAAPYISAPFVDEDFNFFKTILNGIPQNEPRWKRVLSQVSGSIQDPVSKMYVDKYFPPTAKKAASELVDFIILAFKESIQNAAWMEAETIEKALVKLSKFTVKIGYPDKWMDFTPLNGKISRKTSYLENIIIAHEYVFQKDVLGRVDKPVDKSKWEMAPFMVNAYFHPTMNEIVFPAAILQPPFFYAPSSEKPFGEPALNFGAIGGVISHEISHGYDDQGRQYDSKGEIADWWTAKDAEAFKIRAKMMIDQFNKHEVFGENVNGELTQGENIADLGGITVSLVAFKKWIASHPNFKGAKSEFTAIQNYFLAWAQVWRIHIREEAAKQLLVIDPHAPGRWRVDGILNNLPEFHEAFGIKAGDKMYLPHDECVKIW